MLLVRKHVCVLIGAKSSGWLADRPTVQPSLRSGNSDAIFLEAVNVINVKLCTLVLLTKLYTFLPLSVTLSISYDYSSVKHFY